MNRSELIKVFSEEIEGMFDDDPNYAGKVARETVELFFESIKESLQSGDRVEIRGFGSFSVKHYEAYTGRNPKTGEQVEVPEKKLPIFRASKELKKMINDD